MSQYLEFLRVITFCLGQSHQFSYEWQFRKKKMWHEVVWKSDKNSKRHTVQREPADCPIWLLQFTFFGLVKFNLGKENICLMWFIYFEVLKACRGLNNRRFNGIKVLREHKVLWHPKVYGYVAMFFHHYFQRETTFVTYCLPPWK